MQTDSARVPEIQFSVLEMITTAREVILLFIAYKLNSTAK